MEYHVDPKNTSMGRANSAHGSFVSDDTLVEVTLGFQPRKVEMVNATTPTSLLKTASMAAAATFRQVAAGTGTVADAITITENGFTVTAAVAGDEQTWHFYASH